MATVASGALPEQGQLVQVRSRQWIVDDVRPSTLPDPALKPAFAGPQNLITLSSVEDDGLGEELQVVWEIEPGARVIEKAALPNPTGFDAPDKLDAFLDADRRQASVAGVLPSWLSVPAAAPLREEPMGQCGDMDAGQKSRESSLLGDAKLPGKLRAVKVISNSEIPLDGFYIPANMRVPAESVIHRLFNAEPQMVAYGKECMSLWES